MKIFLTGMAGFIGYHTAKALAVRFPPWQVLGLDNINDYYDTGLKYGRLEQLGFHRESLEAGKILESGTYANLRFVKAELQDGEAIMRLFRQEQFDYVIHLAAQAGVRYSLTNPHAYIDSNVTGFLNILEGCRQHPVRHLVYASSSSVYGLNTEVPFDESHRVDHPASLYAATKKMNEAMAFNYAHLFGIPSSGLRFFTVYGEWGRPDMAPILFSKNIVGGKPIQLFNHGNMVRDFTYVGDIVTGILDLLDKTPDNSPPTQLYNIGNDRPVELAAFVEALEGALGKKAVVEYLPMQPGDVPKTWANVDKLRSMTGFRPDTPIEVGLKRFAEWFLEYYQ